VHIEECIDRVD